MILSKEWRQDRTRKKARAAVDEARHSLEAYKTPDCIDDDYLMGVLEKLAYAVRLRNQNHGIGGMPTLEETDDVLADIVMAGMNGSSSRARLDEFLDTKIYGEKQAPRALAISVAGVLSTLTDTLSQKYIDECYEDLSKALESMASDYEEGTVHISRIEDAGDACNELMQTALDWDLREHYRIYPSAATGIAFYATLILNQNLAYKTPLDSGELSPTDEDKIAFSDASINDFQYITDELSKALSMIDEDAEEMDGIAANVHSIYELYHRREDVFSRWAEAQQDMKYALAREMALIGNPAYEQARDDFIRFSVQYSIVIEETRDILKRAVERLDATYLEAAEQKPAEPEPAK